MVFNAIEFIKFASKLFSKSHNLHYETFITNFCQIETSIKVDN